MNTGAQILLLAMTLVLPLAALASRRVAPGTIIKLAATWIAIFALVALLIHALT